MKHFHRLKWALVALFLILFLTSCVGGGYDLQRYQNDAKNHELFEGVVIRYLAGDKVTAAEREELPKAVDEWGARLDADAKVLGVSR
jgi:hypothetical protein